MSLGFLFPGQGSQALGMGVGLSESHIESREVFNEASRILGWDVLKLCREGPVERLNTTEFTQPALLTVSVAALRLLEHRGVRPVMATGHSLGEYTALVAAGALAFSDAVRLVSLRGKYMQEAVPVGAGLMAAVLGLDDRGVEEACREAARIGVVSPANLNAPGQVVIAGETKAVEEACERAKARGAKRCIKLPVSVPSHCDLMRPAAERLAADLDRTPFRDLQIPVVSNVEARPLRIAAEARAALVKQLYSPVRWVDGIRCMASNGLHTFVEIGPGRVLSGLVKRIVEEPRLLNVEDSESLELTLKAVT
jgi:[acyl-carrier-protein] S-malonyltransferase